MQNGPENAAVAGNGEQVQEDVSKKESDKKVTRQS
jgi:hypothetical protein